MANQTDKERLIKYVNEIPNWESYLSEKQLEAVKHYLVLFNCSKIDKLLNQSSGGTKVKIFGAKDNKGAIGRLERVYKIIIGEDYERNTKNIILSTQSIMKLKELLTLVSNHSDYEYHLTSSQVEKVNAFIRYRSFYKASEKLKITQESMRKILIGKDGVLERLQNAYNFTNSEVV